MVTNEKQERILRGLIHLSIFGCAPQDEIEDPKRYKLGLDYAIDRMISVAKIYDLGAPFIHKKHWTGNSVAYLIDYWIKYQLSLPQEHEITTMSILRKKANVATRGKDGKFVSKARVPEWGDEGLPVSEGTGEGGGSVEPEGSGVEPEIVF
jgi:hypothetical protein